MKAYELLFFVNPAIEDETRAAVHARIEETIASQGGVVDSTEEWGKRKLAFEVEKLSEGDYSLVEFHAQPQSIAELDRVLRISDNVVRHIIARREDLD
jgi:small subunit ribosomal protein S6